MGRRPKDLGDMYDAAEENETCVVAFSQSDRQLLMRHAEADGLICPLPGLFARAASWEELNPNERVLWAMRGLAALHPGWIFSSTSAALAHGLRVPYDASRTIHVVLPHRQARLDCPPVGPELVPGKRIHVEFECVKPALFGELPVERHDGLRVTEPLRAVFDSLRDLDFSNGLVVADSFLGTRDLTADELVGRLSSVPGPRQGLSHVTATARYADARAESGGESYARGRMIVNGYAVPDLQVVFADPVDGRELRADFVWRRSDGASIIGEFDGFEKYRNPKMTNGDSADRLLVRQNQRDTHLNLCCDAIFHFCWEDVKRDYRLCNILDRYGVPRA